MKSHFSWDFVLAPFQLKIIAVVNSSAKKGVSGNHAILLGPTGNFNIRWCSATAKLYIFVTPKKASNGNCKRHTTHGVTSLGGGTPVPAMGVPSLIRRGAGYPSHTPVKDYFPVLRMQAVTTTTSRLDFEGVPLATYVPYIVLFDSLSCAFNAVMCWYSCCSKLKFKCTHVVGFFASRTNM